MLRVGVGLLGAKITIAEIMSLGVILWSRLLSGDPTILFGALARGSRQSRPFGILTAGAVAICGASAALAIASVLPTGEDSERDTIFTVIAVTALWTIAMIVYPLIIAPVDLDHAPIGVFLGGTIHDVAQVVGVGFTVSAETGNVATFTKLLRVAMLLPVVVTLSFVYHAHNTTKAGRRLPGFLIAVLVVVNSLGIIPAPVLAALKGISRWCLVTAIAALGMKTSLKAMAEVGGRAIGLIVAETVFLAVLVLSIVLWEILIDGRVPPRPRAAKGGNEMSKDSNSKKHVDDCHQGHAGLGLSAFHPRDHGRRHGYRRDDVLYLLRLGTVEEEAQPESLAARQPLRWRCRCSECTSACRTWSPRYPASMRRRPAMMKNLIKRKGVASIEELRTAGRGGRRQDDRLPNDHGSL